MTRKNPKLEQEKKEKEFHSLTLYVVFSILVLLIYTVVEQILSTAFGVSHEVLTTCVYAAFGGEILACALIKIFKLKTEPKEEVYEDEMDN